MERERAHRRFLTTYFTLSLFVVILRMSIPALTFQLDSSGKMTTKTRKSTSFLSLYFCFVGIVICCKNICRTSSALRPSSYHHLENTKENLSKSLAESGDLRFFCLTSSPGLPLSQQASDIATHEEVGSNLDNFIYDGICRWRNEECVWKPVHDILLNYRHCFNQQCHQQFDSNWEAK